MKFAFWHADKQRSFLTGLPTVPKIRSLHIFEISPEKHGGEVDFLPGNKHESFLEVDIITWVCIARHA